MVVVVWLLQILLVFAVIASAYVLKSGLEQGGRSLNKLVLHCIMIIISVHQRFYHCVPLPSDPSPNPAQITTATHHSFLLPLYPLNSHSPSPLCALQASM